MNKMLRALCYLLFLAFVNCNNNTLYQKNDLSVNEVTNELISTLGIDNQRIKELKDKIDKIGVYLFDKDKYYEYLINEVSKSDLNETSFYKSLNESKLDEIKFLAKGELKHLYLQIKENMNRDDIIKILSEKKNSTLGKSFRKAMLNAELGKINLDDSDDVDTIIDKYIGRKPEDNHKFNHQIEDEQFWDPQGELEDLKEYHRHDARRIYKGERTNIKYYPFMVSIHLMGRFWCGGAIYASDLVLTSAACLQLMHNNRFFRENPGALFIRVGSNHSRIGGERVEALEVYFHPSYNPKTLSNNIAVIRLIRHLRFGRHRVPKRIEVSDNDLGLAPTTEVLVLGWGVTKISQKQSFEPVFLNRILLPVYPNIFCKEVYGEKLITTNMFCAGTFTTGEGACDHDAGGPAILGGKLVGIISFGPAMCGYPNSPTVFTLVGSYLDWIETVKENMPPYYTSRVKTTPFSKFSYWGSNSNILMGTESKSTTCSNSAKQTNYLRKRKEKKTTKGIESDWSVELDVL